MMMSRESVMLLTAVFQLLVTCGWCQTEDPLEAVVAKQGEMIDQLQAQLEALTERLDNQAQQIAFFARFATNQSVHVNGTRSVLMMDHVDLNSGNGFDTTTGVFIAPISGLYLFSLKITHSPPGNIHVQITKEGVGIAEVEASGDNSYNDRSSADVVVRVTEGQRVWVSRSSGTSDMVQGGYMSSFMGVLLKGE